MTDADGAGAEAEGGGPRAERAGLGARRVGPPGVGDGGGGGGGALALGLGPDELVKYHALGNAYLVAAAAPRDAAVPDAARARALCDPACGVGGDGLLALAPAPPSVPAAAAQVAIYNPDGSRAERSGNGLRICARALWDLGAAPRGPTTLATDVGEVALWPRGEAIAAAMGRPSFSSAAVGMAGPPRHVAGEPLALAGEVVEIFAVSVGNPHCVIFGPPPTAARLAALAPQLTAHAAFAAGVNVQLAHVRGPGDVEVQVWERGVGPTSASGTSACAVAAAARARGLVGPEVRVHMPGGVLTVEFAADGSMTLVGTATPIARIRPWPW